MRLYLALPADRFSEILPWQELDFGRSPTFVIL